jgi:DNA-directed RNA polymerase subunit L
METTNINAIMNLNHIGKMEINLALLRLEKEEATLIKALREKIDDDKSMTVMDFVYNHNLRDRVTKYEQHNVIYYFLDNQPLITFDRN